MDKETQPDSMATVTIKPDYAPSEVYSSEPPPAYPRSQSSSVQVAKIIAVTVVLVSFVLGSFLLASAYVTANASCRQLEQELELFNEAADRLQPPPLPEALIQEPHHVRQNTNNLDAQESRENSNQDDNRNVESNDSSSSEDTPNSKANSDSGSSDESEEQSPIFIKLPLQLDFDDLAGALLAKNQRSRMNCVVEKKRAEEIIDHQPKTLNLPFGLNLTTNPRFERLSGERMAIFCESGDMQKQTPPDDDDDDDDEETIMIQPVMIPIPQTHFPTHMAQQAHTMPQQQPHVMRPPMQLQEEQSRLPPNQILHRIAQEIIAHKIMESQKAIQEQNQNAQHNTVRDQETEQVMAQSIPIPEEILSQLRRLPNSDVVVTVSRQEFEEPPQELQRMHPETREPQEMKIVAQQMNLVAPEMRPTVQEMSSLPQQMVPRQPLTETFVNEMRPPLRQLRLIPKAVPAEPQEMQMLQQNMQTVQESKGRESYGRLLPVHIPVQMNQQQQSEAQSIPSEESRPHYVQPRSVRSVDALLPKSNKRVKRCSCDCAC